MKRYVNLYIDEKLVDKIDKTAKKKERSRNYIIVEVLKKVFSENK